MAIRHPKPEKKPIAYFSFTKLNEKFDRLHLRILNDYLLDININTANKVWNGYLQEVYVLDFEIKPSKDYGDHIKSLNLILSKGELDRTDLAMIRTTLDKFREKHMIHPYANVFETSPNHLEFAMGHCYQKDKKYTDSKMKDDFNLKLRVLEINYK